MGKVLKYLAGIILISVFVVGGYYWVQGREPVAAGYALVNVERGDIVEKAVAVGQIEPRMEFHVKSKISGIVRRCYVEVGDAVAPGDPLFEIEPDPTPIELVEAERQVESRESAFRRAQADWKRTSELASQGVISGDEVDAPARPSNWRGSASTGQATAWRCSGRGVSPAAATGSSRSSGPRPRASCWPVASTRAIPWCR
jgi:HlyD family secretion protein